MLRLAALLLALDGKYFTGSDVNIDAVAQVTRAVPLGPDQGCGVQVQDVNDTQWQLTTMEG